MALSAVTPDATAIQNAADAGPNIMAGDWRCGAFGAPSAPKVEELTNYADSSTHTVVVIRDSLLGNAVVGLAVVRNADAKVIWLCIPEGRVVEVGGFLLTRIRNNAGMDPWGVVANPKVYDRLVTLGLEPVGERLYFRGV